MSYCERVRPEAFHSDSANAYTKECVSKLTKSSEFHAYVAHLEGRESLFTLSIIAPLLLFLAFYMDLIFGLTSGYTLSTMIGSSVLVLGHLAASLLFLTMILFASPCAIAAPFIGLFQDIPDEEANLSLVVMSALFTSAVYFLLTDAEQYLPLAFGMLVGARLMYSWRKRHWKRSISVRWPIVSVPLLIGLAGCACQMCSVAVVAASQHALTYSEALHNIPVVVMPLLSAAYNDVLAWQQAEDKVLFVPEGMSKVWTLLFTISLISVVTALMSSVTRAIVDWIQASVMPSHPTTMLLQSIAVLCASWFACGVIPLPLLSTGLALYLYILFTSSWSAEL